MSTSAMSSSIWAKRTMPEGDTLHRIKLALRPLVGHAVEALSLPRVGIGESLVGEVVEDVDAIGKNLLISFSGGLVLHTHLKMTGLWHRYARDEPWRRPRDRAVAVLVAGPFEAVCFSAPIARLVARKRIARELSLPMRGTDVIRDDLDTALVLNRLRALPPETPLCVALLSQGAVSGIGNVYVNELCFRARRSPATPLSLVDDNALRVIIDDAAAVMRQNVDMPSAAGSSEAVAHYRYIRTTTTAFGVAAADARGCASGKGPIAVYGRAGQPCPVCGATIVMTRQGPLRRVTFHCPHCQPST